MKEDIKTAGEWTKTKKTSGINFIAPDIVIKIPVKLVLIEKTKKNNDNVFIYRPLCMLNTIWGRC